MFWRHNFWLLLVLVSACAPSPAEIGRARPTVYVEWTMQAIATELVMGTFTPAPTQDMSTPTPVPTATKAIQLTERPELAGIFAQHTQTVKSMREEMAGAIGVIIPVREVHITFTRDSSLDGTNELKALDDSGRWFLVSKSATDPCVEQRLYHAGPYEWDVFSINQIIYNELPGTELHIGEYTQYGWAIVYNPARVRIMGITDQAGLQLPIETISCPDSNPDPLFRQ